MYRDLSEIIEHYFDVSFFSAAQIVKQALLVYSTPSDRTFHNFVAFTSVY